MWIGNDADGLLIIQSASYIEDGWFIKCFDDETFEVYEIPQYGGEEEFLKKFTNIYKALEYAKSLT